jgi:nicotinate-nucleotide pyrophosphorylase (carboxylating)
MKGLGIDILDIGSEIVDAPLLDMKLDVSVVPPCN